MPSLPRKAVAEFLGTAFLVMAVIGSGIAAQRLGPHDAGLELFENAIVTGAALVAIINALGVVSGAHLNPIVSLVDATLGGLAWGEAAAYTGAQIVGGALGAIIANLMFSLPAISVSTHTRSGGGLWLGEVVATFGLLLVIFGVVRSGRTGAAPMAVGTYITAAYFFTSSTSFANPAVTMARTLSNSFAGITPGAVPLFILMQLVGAALALLIIRVLWSHIGEVAEDVVVPHRA